MPKPPSQKQLGYLKRLGYRGEAPTSSREASAAIDAMLATKDSVKAERALLKERQQDQRESKQRRKQELQAVKQEIGFMVRENRSYGGEGLYAGFRFVSVEDENPSPEDEPYLGAFLPLQVAARHPELLLRPTLEYEEVMSEEKLRAGTRMVVAPGRFQTLKAKSGCFGVVLILGAVMILGLRFVLAVLA